MSKYPRTKSLLISILTLCVVVGVVIGLQAIWYPLGWIVAGGCVVWALASTIWEDRHGGT